MHPESPASVVRTSEKDLPWKKRRIPVPRAHGSVLIEPSRDQIPQLLRNNLESFALEGRQLIAGKEFGVLRRACRREVLSAAVEYSSQWLTPNDAQYDVESPLFMSGHQPQLVHPGAWSKNLLLGQIAKENRGISLNLVVDHDLMESASNNVPAGNRESPKLERLSFDLASESKPWEEAVVVDQDVVIGFATKGTELISRWGINPVLPQVWQTVVELLPTITDWTTLLTAARNRFERSLGIENLEIPMSHLSELQCFKEFVVDLLSHLPEFQEIHNQLLSEFREVYRIRSSSHPVPALGRTDDWWEAPFWIWRGGATQRRPLMIRISPDSLELGVGTESIASRESAAYPGEVWRKLLVDAKSQGWKIRPRALTTTLFVRLFLADLFIHGIGGAHYDEITDRLSSRFYGLPAPEFLTVSAGQLLPLGAFPVSEQEEQAIRHDLWDLTHNPERHLFGNQSRLIEVIQRLNNFARGADRRSNLSERRELQQRLSQLRNDIKGDIRGKVDELQERLEDVHNQLKANRVLASREFSFALFPEQLLLDLRNQLQTGQSIPQDF